MKRYTVLFDQPKRFGGWSIRAGQGLQKDVAIENNIRPGGIHGGQSFAFLTRRLLRAFKQAIDFTVAHLMETAANGLKNIIERLAVSVDKSLQILLWRFAQRACFLLCNAEVLLIQCDRAT